MKQTHTREEGSLIKILEFFKAEDSLFFAFDYTSEKENARICGITIKDGKGVTLYNGAIKPPKRTKIDQKYLNKNNIDINKINDAKTLHDEFPELIKILRKYNKAKIFEDNKAYRKFAKEMNEQIYKDPKTIIANAKDQEEGDDAFKTIVNYNKAKIESLKADAYYCYLLSLDAASQKKEKQILKSNFKPYEIEWGKF